MAGSANGRAQVAAGVPAALPRRRPRGRLTLAFAAGATVLLATGCQAGTTAGARSGSAGTPSSTSSAGGGTTTTTAVTKATAHVVISPASSTKRIAPDRTVSVKATSGKLSSVRVVDAKGASIKGTLNGATWKASSLLKPHSAYTVTASAVGTNGKRVTKVSRFSTLTPKVTATYSLLPTGTVGVGMPVIVRFDSPVATRAERAVVQKHVSITTSPAQVGAWGWQDSSQLMWRPATYWKPGTKVTVSARLQGAKTGAGKYVGANHTGSFAIGPSMISVVNIKTHHMTVTRNGKVVRTIPVSTGRPGAETETRSGVKVIMTREPVDVMDSASIGIPKGTPGYYHIVAKWAMRVTTTGEFLHSAPWSVGSQGHANVSHGCTNLSPVNAKWMYDHSLVGDVVRFTGSNRPFTADEGIGVWTYSYPQWKARSAL